jgi:hypothetical protein
MDGHWEWSESGDEPDTGDTADLGGDDQGYGQTYGQDYGHTFDGHDDFGGDPHGGDPHGGGDDLEEPLGTEDAAEAYDQSVHDAQDAQDAHNAQEGADDADPVHTADADLNVDTDVDGVQHAETFGSDPDLHNSDGWPEPAFPEQLDLAGPPEPVDGFPWSDADTLGGADHSLSAAFDPAVQHTDPADPADLAGYDTADLPAGEDPWGALLSSEDPATSSLAGFWAPHN